jgi:hypothetical protein
MSTACYRKYEWIMNSKEKEQTILPLTTVRNTFIKIHIYEIG